ncbi:MAG: nucleotidyltransferase family protein [Clostridiales bacterium]|nr:nucleotidyltransferase family protein [Clostridiales bacterium]
MRNSDLIFKLSDPYYNETLKKGAVTNQEELFGHIVLNKMVGIAFKKLDHRDLNPELRKTFSLLNGNYLNRSVLYKKQLKYLASVLSIANFDYSLLKGAFLSTNLYESGQRVSNDFDILISSENISKLQKLLTDSGFIQGRINSSNEIIPATRKEILESRLNYGQTVPFVKNVENSPLVIDINFSLDFKASANNIVEEFLNDTIDAAFEDIFFKTLSPVKFLLHLACHLYKEATTYDWVVGRRDLMLYKFCDIYMFIYKYGTTEYFSSLTEQIKKYGLEKECYYTFENASIIYPALNEIDGFSKVKESIKPERLDFMKQIIYPREKKLFKYDMSFTDWFLCPDRISQLEEIPYEEY